MPKVTLETIGSGVGTATLHNSNFQTIEDAFDNTISRDGSSPNQMQAPLDMNGFNILNQGNPITISGFNWEGTWSSVTTYAVGDAIHHEGNAYVSILENSNQAPPNATYWQVLAGGQDANGVDFTPAGSGAVERTVQDKLRDLVSVKDFGAVGDGVTDDTAAIQAAILAHSTVYLPAGTYKVSSDISIPAGRHIIGSGRENCTIKVVGNSSGDRVFVALGTDKQYLCIEGIRFLGSWLENQSETGSNGLITLTQWDDVQIKDCMFEYARFMCINVNTCEQVSVTNCIFKNSVRDCIAVWGTPRVTVTNNTLIGCDDDAISISFATPIVEPVRSNIIVANNHLVDTLGIKMQGAKTFQVTGNTMHRMKGHGIWVGENISTGFEETPLVNGLIANNIITDIIDRQYFVNGTASSDNLRCYIRIDGKPPRAGTLAVPPGTINTTDGDIEAPYSYFYDTSGAANGDPSRPVSGIIVSNNICRRTLPPVTNYSDWGYGQAFTKGGFTNVAVTEAMLRGIGIDIRIPVIDGIQIINNNLRPGNRGVNFSINSFEDRAIVRGVVRGNLIEDCTTACIYFGGTTAVKYQDLVIEDNILDADPNFVSTNRGSGGAWLAPTSPYALYIPYVGGVVVKNNKVRNCSIAIDQTGASDAQYIHENLIFADAAVANFSTSNKGVGTIPGVGAGQQWWIQYEDSDPTSATYKNFLGANLRNFSSMPSSGKWFAGTVVGSRATSVSGTGGSQYVRIGWVRLTTGTGHVLNTDWAELRALTGT